MADLFCSLALRRNYRNTNKKNILFLVFFIASVFLLFLVYKDLSQFKIGKGMKYNDDLLIENNTSPIDGFIADVLTNTLNRTEIQEILKTTPNLWHKFHLDTSEKESDTVNGRVEAQRNWIRRISNTDFIKNAPIKQILVQESGVGDRQLYYGTDNQIQCPYAPSFATKCQLTFQNYTYLDYILDQWDPLAKYRGKDAVIAVRGGRATHHLPERKLPVKIQQIIHILENPLRSSPLADVGRNDAWLASYWRGSDIPLPYAEWQKTGLPSQETIQSIDNLVNRPKLAVALISNCNHVANNRVEFINELRSHVEGAEIHIYGDCGDHACPTNARGRKQCTEFLGENYKFYLAFENANCVDYITEKFFINALSSNIVPVVMGAPIENYRTAAPPNSFIHVDSFDSPKSLGAYLLQLHKNSSMYLKYLKWKLDGNWIVDEFGGWRDFFCRACGMLFYADFVEKPTPWGNDKRMWGQLNKCLPKGEWSWRKHILEDKNKTSFA